jgi:hypothetical protein
MAVKVLSKITMENTKKHDESFKIGKNTKD